MNKKDKMTFTKKQCQQLKIILSDLIEDAESTVKYHKSQCTYWYGMSDKANLSSVPFLSLNNYRDNLRFYKRRVALLSDIQRSVKERLKHP